MAHVNRGNYASTENDNDSQSRRLHSLSTTCLIRPKTTGLVSLFIQLILMIVSAITTMFFFYHVGGYEYTHWNENSTILEPINHNNNRGKPVTLSPTDETDSLVSTKARTLDFTGLAYMYENDSFDSDTVRVFLDSAGPNEFLENASFGIEQVPLTTVVIGDVEFDWLEVIRISTLVYILMCGAWGATGLLFICTIRCEILDSAILNTTVLILVVLFQIVHAILVTSLIFLQADMSWRTMSITVGTIIILFCCAFLGFVCISLNCGWIKYIDFMHGRKKCTICSIFNCCRKPIHVEATTRNGIAHQNDIPLDRFDAF